MSKSYPPQTEDGYHTARPVISRNRIQTKRVIRSFFAKQVGPVTNALTDALGLAKAEGDTPAERAQKAADAVEIDWAPVADGIEPYLISVAVNGADAGLRAIDVAMSDESWNGAGTAATEWAANRAAELVGMRLVDGKYVPNPNAKWRIDDTTRDMLQALVTDAIEEGDSTDALASRIKNAFAFSDERAEMIARTEIARADVQGALIGWQKSGVVAGKRWLAGGPRVCPVCLDHEADGPQRLDYVWGDGVTAPPDHPHCFCVLVAVLEGEPINE